MHFSTSLYCLTALATLSLSRPSSFPLRLRQSLGTATVSNGCSGTIYVQSVGDDTGPITAVDPGTSYSEGYRTTTSGGGVSIKISRNADGSTPLTQLEYALSGGEVFYDVSIVDGSAFAAEGFSLVASDASCASVSCGPNESSCTAAYNQPGGDQATESCSEGASLTFNACAP